MRRRAVALALLVALALVASVTGASAAGADGTKGYGAKCPGAWIGKRGTAAYRAYFRTCVHAAVAATAKAAAGDGDEGRADRAGGASACAHQAAFAPPRNTAAKRAGFKACVRAAVAAQHAFAHERLAATLTGAAEVPGPGDSDATGSARVAVNVGQRRACFTLSVAGLTDVIAAHIHRGDVGVAGPVVVPLAPLPTVGGSSRGCVEDLDRALVKEIKKNPAGFYVNVHSSDFPNGAIRGQLS